jgi:D-alanyl-D-alanine dipeptidase
MDMIYKKLEYRAGLLLSVYVLVLLLLFSCNSGTKKKASAVLPEDFVYLSEIIPGINLEMRYLGNDNFVGKPVNGYEKEVCICTKQAAEALKKVQDELAGRNYSLMIFDAYRPQRAVNHFMRWAKDYSDTLTKQKYYPNIRKKDLFRLNYIASKSSHSRGSTFDLTILDAHGKPLDMGTTFDYFGPESWPSSDVVSPQQKKNRMLLQSLMLKHGFKLYKEEWWHFTLMNEPFPDTYFDFIIK